MPEENYQIFKGISLKLSPSLIGDNSVIAQNVNLDSGKIQPLREDLVLRVESGNRLTFYRDDFVTATDTFFLTWRLNNRDVLLKHSPTGFKKVVDGIEADVGQNKPVSSGIVVSVGGILDEETTYNYAITFIRSVGGQIDESEPLLLNATTTLTDKTITITLPTGYDSSVVAWNVYRLSSITGKFEIFPDGQVDILAVSYVDDGTFSDGDLDEEIGSFFQAIETNDFYSNVKPPDLDGIASSQFAGMVFGWKGSTLYWSRVGLVDAWPVQFNLNLPTPIKGLVRGISSLIVVTDSKVFSIQTNNPFIMELNESGNKSGAVNERTVEEYYGAAVYLTEDGIDLFDGVTSKTLTENLLPHKFFQDLDSDNSFIETHNNIIYMGHIGGVVLFDFKDQNITTLTGIYLDFHAREDGIYALKDDDGLTKLVKLFSHETDTLSFVYRSGEKLLGNLNVKNATKVEFNGNGQVSVKMILDGEVQPEVDINFATRITRTIGIPHNRKIRSFQYEVTGTGEIQEITVRGF